jgi:predicted nucleic acid-binding protein
MAESVLVDAGFLVALLSRRDTHHSWAVAQLPSAPSPWLTCEAVLSEACHLLGPAGIDPLGSLLQREVLRPAFDLGSEREPVFRLLKKYSSVPMSLADACLVRMTETLPAPMLVTTDRDFRIYRRHGRQTIPVLMP